jgi:Histidyl-tRNA synthetase
VRAQTANAPYIVDYLCGDCKAHHDTVRALLSRLDIPFDDAPRLVRASTTTCGPRTSSTTRCSARSRASAAAAATTGSEDIGGPPLPGIGFAVGLDRIVLAIEAERARPLPRRDRASPARSSAWPSASLRLLKNCTPTC